MYGNMYIYIYINPMDAILMGSCQIPQRSLFEMREENAMALRQELHGDLTVSSKRHMTWRFRRIPAASTGRKPLHIPSTKPFKIDFLGDMLVPRRVSPTHAYLIKSIQIQVAYKSNSKHLKRLPMERNMIPYFGSARCSRFFHAKNENPSFRKDLKSISRGVRSVQSFLQW